MGFKAKGSFQKLAEWQDLGDTTLLKPTGGSIKAAGLDANKDAERIREKIVSSCNSIVFLLYRSSRMPDCIYEGQNIFIHASTLINKTVK